MAKARGSKAKKTGAQKFAALKCSGDCRIRTDKMKNRETRRRTNSKGHRFVITRTR